MTDNGSPAGANAGMRDPELLRAARVEAARFVAEERDFHLGVLPTEQSHPKTRSLSETTFRSTREGVAMLLSVDHDLPPKAEQICGGAQFAALVDAVRRRAETGGRVGFSGCGATGRLAIILEKMWRVFWDDAARRDPARGDRWRRVRDAGYSIMTGGDRALIRSVENFEDFQSFGRRQVADAGLAPGDLLVAISEGGETSSVIGTVWEALDRGATVFFVYNNPSEILKERVPRSREIIDEPRIVKLDLATGPMALSGSTRLQATTMEMLVVGAALESACAGVVAETQGAGWRAEGGAEPIEPSRYPSLFEELVASLEREAEGIGGMVDLEAELYASGGLVTYVCDEFLLDIISDTTERTPTFMLPPFRPAGDSRSPVSWAFTKDPLRTSEEAWLHMLARPPRGLSWRSDDYRSMGGLPRMVASPPALDNREILSYHIGREHDPSRFEQVDSALVLVSAGTPPAREVLEYLEANAADYGRTVELTIGESAHGDAGHPYGRYGVPVPLPVTPMRLFTHLAVKLVLNTLSTATMAKLGRIRGNWMIQLDATNKKLIDRATRIIADLAGISYEEACGELHLTLLARARGDARQVDSAVVETLRRRGVA